MGPRKRRTVTTHFKVFETTAPGEEREVYDHTDQKLCEHIARKGNAMRAINKDYPSYDVRVVVPA